MAKNRLGDRIHSLKFGELSRLFPSPGPELDGEPREQASERKPALNMVVQAAAAEQGRQKKELYSKLYGGHKEI